jgi:hypothetical protein
MYNKQQLKPLAHNKIVNSIKSVPKIPLSKDTSKPQPFQSPSTDKVALTKKSSNGEIANLVKF